MSPPTSLWHFAAEADLEGGWRLGYAIAPNGEAWPVICDTHQPETAPILLGPTLAAAAPHEVV